MLDDMKKTLWAAADKLLAPLIDRMVANALHMRTLTSLRDTILPRLISGRLRLPEAEALIQDVTA